MAGTTSKGHKMQTCGDPWCPFDEPGYGDYTPEHMCCSDTVSLTEAGENIADEPSESEILDCAAKLDALMILATLDAADSATEKGDTTSAHVLTFGAGTTIAGIFAQGEDRVCSVIETLASLANGWKHELGQMGAAATAKIDALADQLAFVSTAYHKIARHPSTWGGCDHPKCNLDRCLVGSAT